jgi:predicted signal transduction protein with EAL and GGDEF domain
VIVEGAETADQVEMIKSWGCRQVQGFYFARPMPASEITGLLRARTALRGPLALPPAAGVKPLLAASPQRV